MPKIRKVLFAVLRKCIGPHRSRRLRHFLRFRRGHFSEADLIWNYFSKNPRHGVMIDVGAHFGESLEPYLEMGWRVLAFEPDAANRRKLLEIVKHTGMLLFDAALADEERKGVPFYASEESDGISGLSAFRPSHREVQRVDVTTLSKILKKEPVPKVDFLKIDTEGHDLFVLKGFPWSKYIPEVVLCEFEDSKTIPLGYDHRALGDFLLAQGYEVYLSEWHPIVRYGVQHRWRNWTKYPCNLQEAAAWGNFVAFRSGVDRVEVDSFLKLYRRLNSQ